MTFFICIAQLAQELSDSIGMRSHSRCIKQDSTQFGHRDIAILSYNLGKQSAMGIQLTLPLGRPCGAASARPFLRIASAHRAPVAGDNFKRNAAARPLKPSSMYR